MKKIVIIASSVAVLVVLLVIIIYNVIQRGWFVKIDNFGDYYYNVPEETQNIIFNELKRTIEVNAPGKVPQSGAFIRDSEPYIYRYNNNYNGYIGEFIVDIPDIQQSYLVKFNFNEDPKVFSGGYAVLVYCLEEDRMIYPDFNCQENLPFYTNGEVNTTEDGNGE